MTHEKWLALTLAGISLVILALVTALTWQLGWSWLGIATLVFFLSYPIIWLSWRLYRFWCDAIMMLTTYTQTLKESHHNLRFKKQHPDNLLLDLQREIAALAQLNQQQNHQTQTIDNILSHILDAWPIPVCLFDQDLKLTYRNNAMNDYIQQPMLLGTHAEDLGFSLNDQEQFGHAMFGHHWQSQSISYQYQQQKQWLFSALNVSERLKQNQSVTQQNLIRVLGHELRNSLTPMSSMADTLLSAETLSEDQVRLVLSRIQQRSNRLLTFISEYSQLSQLPAPDCQWFAIDEVIDEAKVIMTGDNRIELQGSQQCWGDITQVSQVIINLVKNAQEACHQSPCIINIKLFYQSNNQIIEFTDNGPGFANLDNVLTPFYTTKPSGSGIGLSLCAEIANNHNGQLNVANCSTGGAKIMITWPMTN